MRTVSLLAALTFAVLAFAQAPVPPSPPAPTVKALLKGRVTNAAGEPLRRANVTLNPTPEDIPPEAFQNRKVYSTETDASGAFTLDGIEAGSFFLTVERTGYLVAFQTLEIEAGAKLDDLVVQMVRQGLIAGKITDEFGDPYATEVTLYRRIYRDGRWRLGFVQSVTASAEGTYSIGGIDAGRYYVGASGPMWDGSFPVAEQKVTETEVTTFYPNAADQAAASVVEVASGATVRGIDIRMGKGKVYQVRGKAVGVSAMAADSEILLVPVASPSRPNATMLRGSTGTFQFQRVTPGTYIIQAHQQMAVGPGAPRSAGPLLAGRQAITVGNRDLEDVVLQLAPAAEIAGTVRTEGETGKIPVKDAGSQPPNREIVLFPVDVERKGPPDAKAQMDGTFVLKDVVPGPYSLEVGELAAGEYVKTVRYEGVDVTRKLIDFPLGAAGKLEIVLGTDGAGVTGIVRTEKGEAYVGAVTVTLWAPGPVGGPPAFMVGARAPGGKGTFAIGHVPPGDYRLAAWEWDETGVTRAPEFLRQFEAQATRVKLGSGGQQSIEVKLIQRAAMEKAAAQVP